MSKRRGAYLIAGFVLLLILFAVVGQQLSIGYTSRLSCCVKDGTTGGGLAIVRWAEQLSWRVQPLYEPICESLRKLKEPSGNCVITAGNGPWSPWREEMEDEEWGAVRGWVRRGNALIVLTTEPDTLPSPIKNDLLGSNVKPTAVGVRLPFRWLEPAVPSEPEITTVQVPGDGQLEVAKEGERLSPTPEDWEIAGDDRGSVWNRIPVGEGAVYLIVDGFAWTNAGFDRPENAKALAAVLRRELRGGVLGFDEFRHGHGRVESLGTLLLGVPGAKPFIWIGLILLALYFYGRNVRFGPPEPYEHSERRTAREYIEAVAYLYQRARAAPLTVQAVERRFRQIARVRGHVTPEAESLEREIEEYVATESRPADPIDACELVSALVRMRKKLYGS
jgi:Domain of unknown function (DUF4350)